MSVSQIRLDKPLADQKLALDWPRAEAALERHPGSGVPGLLIFVIRPRPSRQGERLSL